MIFHVLATSLTSQHLQVIVSANAHNSHYSHSADCIDENPCSHSIDISDTITHAMLKVPFYDGSGGDVHMIVSCLTASEIAQIYTDYTVLHTTLETLITARGGFTDQETEAFETVTGDMHLEQVLLASDLIDSIFPQLMLYIVIFTPSLRL